MGKDLSKSWTLRDDQIVLMSLMPNTTHQQIADMFGITRQAVSQKIADPRGQEIVEMARRRLRENLVEGIDGELDNLTRLAVRKLKVTLEADIAAVHGAKPNQDKVALSLLKGRGFLREEGKGAEGGIQMSPEQFGRLVEGMAKADEAQRIDPFEGRTEVTVIKDVPVEILDPNEADKKTGTDG